MTNHYRIQQRVAGAADLVVRGTCLDDAASLEARWAGGSWADIAHSSGLVDAVLAAQAEGQGTLECRRKLTTPVSQVLHVGIGDVFGVAGQSNAYGETGADVQAYSHAALKAGCFYRNYAWGELLDPIDRLPTTDGVTGTTTPGGTFIPVLATAIMADQGVPVGFVPCAKGATAIASWAPGGDHQDRGTLYGSMVYRCLAAGGVKAVLWWQGESDALAGTTGPTYLAALQALGDAVFADLGCPLVACTTLNCSGLDPTAQGVINTAIQAAWGTHHVVAGPNLTGINSDDSFHALTTATIASVAALWWTAIQTAFY